MRLIRRAMLARKYDCKKYYCAKLKVAAKVWTGQSTGDPRMKAVYNIP
jgi:hypothetical protein